MAGGRGGDALSCDSEERPLLWDDFYAEGCSELGTKWTSKGCTLQTRKETLRQEYASLYPGSGKNACRAGVLWGSRRDRRQVLKGLDHQRHTCFKRLLMFVYENRIQKGKWKGLLHTCGISLPTGWGPLSVGQRSGGRWWHRRWKESPEAEQKREKLIEYTHGRSSSSAKERGCLQGGSGWGLHLKG